MNWELEANIKPFKDIWFGIRLAIALCFELWFYAFIGAGTITAILALVMWLI